VDAREVHACGSPDAAELVKRLCERSGDEFVRHEYDRLTPLTVEDEPLKDWTQLRKGDCVVTFSRKDIHGVRAEISRETGMRCGVVYGQLPPETRSHQAKLFNDEASNYDVLVASDAIGMGLNLNIRRVIFQSTQKFARQHNKPASVKTLVAAAHDAGLDDDDDDDELLRQVVDAAAAEGDDADPEEDPEEGGGTLSPSSSSSSERSVLKAAEKAVAPVEPALVKQIAGRAGRKSTLFGDDGGLVCATTREDLEYVRRILKVPKPPPLTKAGVFPPQDVLAAFARERPVQKDDEETLDAVIGEFARECRIDEELLFFCGHHELSSVASKLNEALKLQHALPSPLPVADALVFCSAPCNTNDRFALGMLASYAAKHYEAVVLGKPSRVAPNVRIPQRPPTFLPELHDLCSKHNVLDLYVWLHFRYPNTFPEAAVARAQKARCIDLIAQALQADIKSVKRRAPTDAHQREDARPELEHRFVYPAAHAAFHQKGLARLRSVVKPPLRPSKHHKKKKIARSADNAQTTPPGRADGGGPGSKAALTRVLAARRRLAARAAGKAPHAKKRPPQPSAAAAAAA